MLYWPRVATRGHGFGGGGVGTVRRLASQQNRLMVFVGEGGRYAGYIHSVVLGRSSTMLKLAWFIFFA